MRKFATMESVKGTIEPQSVDIYVDDMELFVKELNMRTSVTGGVLTVLNLYDFNWRDEEKRAFQFTENGFTFTWSAVGPYSMTLS